MRIDNEGCRKMLFSSLADRMNLYEDHFHTLIDNSDKYGRFSKHETAKVERCFESMNDSEKMSSEAPLWMLQHRIESDRLRLVAFLLPMHGSNPNFYI